MNENRIARRLNVIIVLLLGIIGLLSYESVTHLPAIVGPLVAIVLVPGVILLLAWGLAKISWALESSYSNN